MNIQPAIGKLALHSEDYTRYVGTDWRHELRKNIRTIDELKQYVSISPKEEEDLQKVIGIHPMSIPAYYAQLIDWNNPNDPLKKIALPSAEELLVIGDNGNTTTDPYGDAKHDKGNGILHKYPYSVLVIATEQCSLYCRHCFRKVIVGLPDTDKTVENFEKVAEYLSEHKEVRNLIISGGDPGTLTTYVLSRMFQMLEDIDHINYVRLATRAPVNFPARFFDDELIELFRNFNRKKTLYIPTHFNHPRELTSTAAEAVLRIRNAGVIVNNQAVLLKGVNDNVSDIVALMNGLVRMGINPYYLYQCMPVSRVRHHFQIPLIQAVSIVENAKRELDGYAKRFKFIMGHDSGKIEICGKYGDNLIMSRIHSRPEDSADSSQIIIRKLNQTAGWFDELEEI